MSMTQAPGDGEGLPILAGRVSRVTGAVMRCQPSLAAVFVTVLIYATTTGLQPTELVRLLVTVGLFLIPAELIRCWAAVFGPRR